MIARKYETRLDENGLVTFEKVWSKRMDSYNSNHQFRNPDEVYELCKTLKLDTYAEEHAFLLIFDSKMHFKSFVEIGIGTNRVCVIDRRGIAQKVLILNAGAFVVIHNHPSGDPTPSKLDIDAAKTIDEIGQLIDIPMKDFMMIGSETYYSVKENGDI
jgi:DNA repair protein RadC